MLPTFPQNLQLKLFFGCNVGTPWKLSCKPTENTERNLRNYYEDESHLSGQTLHFHCSSTASKALRRPHQCLYEQKDFLKCNITTDQDFLVFM